MKNWLSPWRLVCVRWLFIVLVGVFSYQICYGVGLCSVARCVGCSAVFISLSLCSLRVSRCLLVFSRKENHSLWIRRQDWIVWILFSLSNSRKIGGMLYFSGLYWKMVVRSSYNPKFFMNRCQRGCLFVSCGWRYPSDVGTYQCVEWKKPNPKLFVMVVFHRVVFAS